MGLIRKLHSGTTCQINFLQSGKPTSKIAVDKGVKQRCILVPTLFTLFLNDLVPFLFKVDSHCLKLGSMHIPVLLYADDALLIFHS